MARLGKRHWWRHFHVPQDFSGLRIKCDQARVYCADKHAAIGNRYAAIGRATAQFLPAPLVLITPQFLASVGIQRGHMRKRQRNVHDAAHHNWRGLEGSLDATVPGPLALQLADVAGVNFDNVGKPVIVAIQAVQGPVT